MNGNPAPTVACYVAVPVAAFRNPRAREYLETLPVPPPATVYGMLCAAVGETNRLAHRGAQLAIAVIAAGVRSRVLRTVWRVKDLKVAPGSEENKRPDYQELLLGIRLAVHVREGESEARPTLAQRVAVALQSPGLVERFGGLSLGESTHLVDELRWLRPSDVNPLATLEWLIPDPAGRLALPVWPDHVGSRGTRYVQVNLVAGESPMTPPDTAWITIAPPTG